MILAIDPSLTGTAVVRGDLAGYDIATFGSKNIGDGVANRVERYDDLVNGIMAWIGMGRFDAIFIEGYGFDSTGRGKFSAEFGGILRRHLVELSDHIYEVAPSTLKKFATGKGAGPKDMIAAHLTKRYGVLLNNNDEYDAFGLYRLGLVAQGLCEADNQAQREAADRVLGITRPKPKKKRAAEVL